MGKRYDVLAPTGRARPDGRAYLVRVGTMFENRNGFGITLDALPIGIVGQDGRLSCRLVVLPADSGQSSSDRSEGPLDDEVPF